MFDRVLGTPEVNLARFRHTALGLLRVVGISVFCNHTVGMSKHPTPAVVKTFTEVSGCCVSIGRF